MNQTNRQSNTQTNNETNKQTHKQILLLLFKTENQTNKWPKNKQRWNQVTPHAVAQVHRLITSAQVHYASVDHIPQEGDDSGVFLQYTEQVGGPMFEQTNPIEQQS